MERRQRLHAERVCVCACMCVLTCRRAGRGFIWLVKMVTKPLWSCCTPRTPRCWTRLSSSVDAPCCAFPAREALRVCAVGVRACDGWCAGVSVSVGWVALDVDVRRVSTRVCVCVRLEVQGQTCSHFRLCMYVCVVAVSVDAVAWWWGVHRPRLLRRLSTFVSCAHERPRVIGVQGVFVDPRILGRNVCVVSVCVPVVCMCVCS